MSLEHVSVLSALMRTDLSTSIRESSWAVMALEAVHLIGLTLLGGAAIIPEDAEFPIRGVSLALPLLVVGQLFLGAAARHKAIGSIYHICFAPCVTAMVLWVSMRILLHYARNRELRISAVALITIL